MGLISLYCTVRRIARYFLLMQYSAHSLNVQETTNMFGYLLDARTGFSRTQYIESLSAIGSLLGTSGSRNGKGYNDV